MPLAPHLYRRGSVYWWRRILPDLGRTGEKNHRREIRLSLRTNMPALARLRGRRLSVVSDAVLRFLSDAMLSGTTIDTHALRCLVSDILDLELDRAEVARALSGERSPEEQATRAQAEIDAAEALCVALAANRLDAVRDVLDQAIGHGLEIPVAGTAEHAFLARQVLRGLAAVHRTNAQLELGRYPVQDDACLPVPPAWAKRDAVPVTPAARDKLPGKFPPSTLTATPTGGPAKPTPTPSAPASPALVALQTAMSTPEARTPSQLGVWEASSRDAMSPPPAGAALENARLTEMPALGSMPVADGPQPASYPSAPAENEYEPALVIAEARYTGTEDALLGTPRSTPAMECLVVSTSPVPEDSPSDWTVTQAMGTWIARQQAGSGHRKKPALCHEEERNYRVAAELFASLVAVRRVIEITEQDLERFKSELHRVPSLFGRSRYRGLSGAEAVRAADALQAAQIKAMEVRKGTIDPDNLAHEKCQAAVPRLAMKTVNKHIDKIKGLLRWLAATNNVPIDTKLLNLKLRYNSQDLERAPKDERAALSNAELRTLFSGPAWTGCAGANHRHRRGTWIIRDAKFWLPLCMAHMGFRSGEAAQLLIDDVVLWTFDADDFTQWDIDIDAATGPWARLRPFSPPSQDGVATFSIWCIKVAPDDGEKRVKTAGSKRLLPVHPLLLELGFLDYVTAQRQAGKLDLFPGLKPEKAHRAGAKLGEWFSRYLGHVGMKRDGVAMYSLRHSFDTHLLNREVPDVRVSELMGHTQQGLTKKRYYKGAEFAKLVEAIASINYRLHVDTVDGALRLVSPSVR